MNIMKGILALIAGTITAILMLNSLEPSTRTYTQTCSKIGETTSCRMEWK